MKNMPDSQGWVTLGLYVLTTVVFGLIAWNPNGLRDNDLFKTLAQAIVITGLINLAIGYYFGAAKPPKPAAPQEPAEPGA